jgi:hypothetical protein
MTPSSHRVAGDRNEAPEWHYAEAPPAVSAADSAGTGSVTGPSLENRRLAGRRDVEM